MNPDFLALLRELSAADARYLIVGAYAVTFHSRPRGTGHLDLWVAPAAENPGRVYQALKRFGAPLAQLTLDDFTRPETVVQVGVPPRRIDLLTSLTGLEFESAWSSHVEGRFGDLICPFIGRDDLIRNKLALGRARDLADVEMMRGGE